MTESNLIILAVPLGIYAAWLAYAHFKLPKMEVKKLDGRGGYNSLTKAVVDPDVRYPAAVLGQEVFESRWKKWPHRVLLNSTAKGIRERELRGHEAEVQVAKLLKLHTTETEREHRLRKARNVLAWPKYRKAFKGWDEERFVRAMHDHSREGAAFAREWAGRLQKVVNQS